MSGAGNGPTNVAGDTVKLDVPAARFATTCAACHSLTGAKLAGPELTPATAWPMDQLKAAVKRMEKNVGPMTDEQITALAELLKSPNVRGRIKAEQERIQSQFVAKIEPPNAATGQALFTGREPLRNGGLPCSACHSAGGKGGNLGPNLDGTFAKMGGETPLVSAIEQAGFKIMAPHYQRHPITPQEAVHLAKYLSTLDPNRAAPTKAPFAPFGTGGALALLAGLTVYFRTQRTGRGTKLQRRR